MSFFYCFQSEWLKTKRSLAAWLVFAGAFFTPSIILLSRIKNAGKLSEQYRSDDFWLKLWNQAWESMGVFLLPIGIILAAGLIVQIEYKNNAWKQVHTTPQRFATIYLAKFLVLLILLLEVFVLFNLGLYLSAVIPSAMFADLPYPAAPIPYGLFLRGNINFFIDCLPILALQYVISLQFKNFLVPVGVGFVIWFLGIGMLAWDYSYLLPYNHGTIDYFVSSGHFGDRRRPPINVQFLAWIYFIVVMIGGYISYVAKKEKG